MKSTLTAATLFLALAFTAAQSSASETASLLGREANLNQGTQAKGSAFAREAKVRLYVRIPSARLVFNHHLAVAPGTLVIDALKMAYNVDQGLVCCDSRDVKGINGLLVDPHKEKWWVVRINGNMQNASSRSKLNDGDVVEWIYEEKDFYEPKHIRLEDWVNERMKKNG